MFKNLLATINKRKVKVFSLFLLCSFLAWTISKLSDSYESRASFELTFHSFPDSLLLNTADKKNIEIKLRTSGFQFLRYKMGQKKLKVNLSSVQVQDELYFVTDENLKVQFEKQFPNNTSLLELESELLYVDLYQVILKEVPIQADVSVNLAQNHLMKGNLLLEPSVATLKGPRAELVKIDKITTVPFEFNGLTQDFTQKLTLIKPDLLVNTQLLTKTVRLSGKVTRFSEKEFTVPVAAINTPTGYRIRMFPNTINVVCKASVDRLKNLNEGDFDVVVDCSKIERGENTLQVELLKTPPDVFAVRLLRSEIEFVLEKL
ncbi:hypothetical protein MTsPCn5_03060 [Croceitalea sp. MTPC5]|uniref:CdaR family protein n=1 Tax=Croceitalea sp. MTPC5 TaxID=3056565 RepID=UPI002B3B8A41|nr:hypothetical protein MTsPCn5_03060 [Croceitalea sp. MTPC5]